jgi:hypothetical protein
VLRGAAIVNLELPLHVRAAGAAHVEPALRPRRDVIAGAEAQLLPVLKPEVFPRLRVAAGKVERKPELAKLPWLPLVHQCEPLAEVANVE